MPSFRLSLLFIMLLFFTAAGVLRAQVPPADEIKPTSLLELNTTTEAGQWVSVDAFIWIWRYTAPRLELRLNTRDSWGTAFITLDDPAQLPKGLHGAKVRLTGQATGKRNRYNGLLVPSLQQMEVLQPGTDDPFLPDVVPLEAVARHQIEWGRRVTVRGTLCTFANPADLLISHGGVGLHCVLTMGWTPGFGRSDIAGGTTVIPEMSPGDEVEITGSLVESEQGNKVLAELTYCHVRVIGKGTAPQPRPVPISHLAKFKEYSEWVSVEGIVNAWVWDGVNLTLGLLDPHSASVKQTVLNAASMPFPEDLFGARVRLTGMTRAMLPEAEYNLCVPSPQYFEVLQPGAKDAFDAPEHPLADVARRTVPPADRVRLRGVLLARPLPDVLHIRHQDTAICAKLDRPWNRSSAPATRFAGIGPWPENLAIGDEVEIVGHPLPEVEDATRQLYDFDSAIVRVIKSGGTPPAPRQSALDDIISGSFTADLVETRGRLVSIDQMPAGQVYWRTSLQLESAAGVLLPAVSYSQKPPSTKTLRVDDEVLLRGLVSRATSQTPRQLWFSSAAEDVKSLGVSPVVFTRQLWRWGGGGVAVLLLLGGWITLLRRTNRLQSQNATFLEQKVEERTTELQKAQTELQRALEQERELGELKSRFVTMVSHEFRTPLGIIMSAVELLQHYSDRLPEDEKTRQLAEIQSSTKHMGGLMEQVLLLGRAEAGKLTCKPRPLDIVCFADRIIDETQSISDRKCPITLETGGDLAGASVDEALLRHILSNLVANAVKYSPPGAEVLLRIRRESREVVFMIIDRGIGIPEKDRARLFEAFHRCSNVGDTPGTGLGLVIVKRCVDLHGGSIHVTSETGCGTTFTVRLPLFTQSAA